MRKLLNKTVLLTALAVLLLTATAFASEIGTAVVTGDALRLRSEPNTNCSTLTYLIEGTKLHVYEELEGWFKVSYGEYTGYVSADFVEYTPAQEEKENEATINGSDVNFRAGPSTEYDVIGKLNLGDTVTIIAQDDQWCYVQFGQRTGYVSAEFISVGGVAMADARGIVTGSDVNVRTGPSTDHEVITRVNAGKVMDLLGLSDGWYEVEFDDVHGFISADYVREYTGSTASSIGEEAAALALSYLGTPYVWGGASPKGFDCSGFTLYIFAQFGYSFPHSATSQWFNCGEYVERADLQPGDLVLFADPSRSAGKACSHVGIYIGNGEFVHASSGSAGKYVRISSLTEGYYSRYYKGAKRIG